MNGHQRKELFIKVWRGEVVITYKERTGNCYIDIDFPTHGQKTFSIHHQKDYLVAIN